jgi:hypothetical protein
MAIENTEGSIALNVVVKTDKANLSLGELEDGFEALQTQLKQTNRGTKEGRKQFDLLATQMAQTTAEIKNIELAFEGLDKEQVASELGSVAGGIGDITASLVLLGGENETIEQIGASIEKAMAISMGFKGAIEGLSSANKLYNNLLKQGKVALIAKTVAEKAAAAGTWLLNTANKALNLTLKANPIGLIVTALGLVVAGIVYFKDAIMNIMEVALKPFQFIIDILIDGLQAMGIMASDEAIAQEKAAEKKIESYRKQAKELEKLREAHERLSETVIGGLEYELELLKAKGEDTADAEWNIVNQKKKAAKEAKKIAQDEYDNSKKLIDLRRAQNKEVTDEDIQALNALVDNVHATRDAYIDASRDQTIFFANRKRERKEEREKEAEAEKAAAEKAAAEAKKRWEAGAADRAMARSKESQAKKDALMEDIERVEIDKTMQTEELDRHSIHIEGLISNEQALRDAMIQFSDAQLIKIEEERQARLAANQERLESASQVIGAIGSLNSAALATDLKNAGNNEKKKEQLRKASFEREKKLNIAMALVNGAQAQMSILAQTPKADFGIATAIAMAAAAVTTIAQIAAIKATSYQGGGSPAASESASVPSAGGAGAAGGGAAISPVSNTSTILGNQQVFVTETDITETQNNVSVIEESATF